MILSKRSAYAFNPIEEEDKVAEKLIESGKSVIKLNRGDPAVYFKTPEYIINAYINALKEGRTSYSDAAGNRGLREAIAARYKRMYHAEAEADDVVLTHGVSEALMLINAMLVNEGEKAIMFRPFYPLYIPDIEIYGGEAILEDYDEKLSWNIDPDKLERRLKKDVRKNKHGIKYMMITNPNNPTGAVLDRKSLQEVVELANEYGIFLISDEIYDELIYNGARFTSMSKLAEGVPHMILNGASKDYDATGFRLGYALVPGKDKVSTAIKDKLRDFAMVRLSVNTPAQLAFKEAIENRKEHAKALAKMVREIESRINFAVRHINRSSYMHTVTPRGAFYIFPKLDMQKLRMKSDAEFVDRFLREEYVQLTRGSGFGANGHVRIVGLPPKDIMETALEKMDSFCRKHAK